MNLELRMLPAALTIRGPRRMIERHVVAYGDGSTVTYDREAGEMVWDLVGDLKINAAGNVEITGNRIDLN